VPTDTLTGEVTYVASKVLRSKYDSRQLAYDTSRHIYKLGAAVSNSLIQKYNIKQLASDIDRHLYEILNRFAFSATVYPTTNLYFEADQGALPSTVEAYSQTTQKAILKISWTWNRPSDADVWLRWDDAQTGQKWYAADNGNFTDQVSWTDSDFSTTKLVLSSTYNSNPDYIWLKSYIPGAGGTESFNVYLKCW